MNRFVTKDHGLYEFLASRGFRMRGWRDLKALGLGQGDEYSFDDSIELRAAIREYAPGQARAHQRSISAQRRDTVIRSEADLLAALLRGQ